MLWVDAQLSPALAGWITQEFDGVEAFSVRRLGLRDAADADIFEEARQADAVVMSKDQDFVELVERLGPPPQVIWITCGNTSNARMRSLLKETLNTAKRLLESGERVVEISGKPGAT